MRQEEGSVTGSEGREVATIALFGDLSAQRLDELRRTLAQAESADVAVLDVSAVEYVDSTVLTAFVLLHRRMREAGRLGTVRIAAPNDSVRRILEICHLDKLFEIYKSLGEALGK
jgi:anti-sigma B factor antagonist